MKWKDYFSGRNFDYLQGSELELSDTIQIFISLNEKGTQWNIYILNTHFCAFKGTLEEAKIRAIEIINYELNEVIENLKLLEKGEKP